MNANTRLDDLFSALADSDCRTVLYHFQESDDAVATLDELVELNGACEAENRDESQRRITLHHSVLPKLDDLDVVEYEPAEQRVQYRDPEWIEPLITEVKEFEKSA
ncbi:hypothetical protein VB773_05305 [Haloarculaceae archaeon H-GB2-1]|nr:hypothetical protein [Haloarculaceae archaeon H-GB1-1]MEA5388993.1 hypothetical protein [Haloarculaceae archaeon H-GB11]MEA5407052.1 hypothetical protein [Haloarculaceae archaeon H-GB2-1]